MKNIFPGYCRKSEKEIKDIWQSCTLVFDANVLLNLYRYSNSTRETIIELIGKFSDKIWLTHQAALEYNRNRYEVIADQEKAYKEFIEKIIQIQKDLQSTNKPPFLSDDVHQDLNTVFTKVNSEVEESIKKYCDFLKEDPIYDKLSDLFDGRIGEAYNDEKLKEIYTEGEKRFKLKLPPGYEDEKNKEGTRMYGDLVLWKQIIDKAKSNKLPVIFITDERKTDWWWKIKDGRNMGPRQELVEEIKREANVDFHMYSSERFLSYGQSFLQENVNQKALEEIQAMKKAEIDSQTKMREAFVEEMVISRQRKESARRQRLHINILNERISKLQQEQESLRHEAVNNPEVQEFVQNMSIELESMIEYREKLKREHGLRYERGWESEENDSFHREVFIKKDESKDDINK